MRTRSSHTLLAHRDTRCDDEFVPQIRMLRAGRHGMRWAGYDGGSGHRLAPTAEAAVRCDGLEPGRLHAIRVLGVAKPESTGATGATGAPAPTAPLAPTPPDHHPQATCPRHAQAN